MVQRRRWWDDLAWRFVVAVAPRLISAALWLLSLTVRVRLVGLEPVFERWARGEQLILAFWHNRVVMMPLQTRGQRVCIMNSQHRDGEIATRALARWDILSVRGSATRGGVGGFLQLVDAYRRGFNLAVVPDGPRGPRYKAKPGVIHLAKATGATLFPISYAPTRRKNLRSWDRLIIPLPFAKVVYVGGEPLSVPRDSSDETLEELRVELERRLNAATEAAEVAARE